MNHELMNRNLLILLNRCISDEKGSLPKGQLRTTVIEYLRRSKKMHKAIDTEKEMSDETISNICDYVDGLLAEAKTTLREEVRKIVDEVVGDQLRSDDEEE